MESVIDLSDTLIGQIVVPANEAELETIRVLIEALDRLEAQEVSDE